MNKIPNFDEFLNEGINDLAGVSASIAKKVATTLNKQKEYTLPEIAKAIASHGGVAAMHSRDVKKVMDELEKDGFKMKAEEEKKP